MNVSRLTSCFPGDPRPAPPASLMPQRLNRLRHSIFFGDDEIAEAVDEGRLTLENERGGVELGDDGWALDAGAGAQSGAGVDAGVCRPAFEKKPARASARLMQGGC